MKSLSDLSGIPRKTMNSVDPQAGEECPLNWDVLPFSKHGVILARSVSPHSNLFPPPHTTHTLKGAHPVADDSLSFLGSGLFVRSRYSILDCPRIMSKKRKYIETNKNIPMINQPKKRRDSQAMSTCVQ